MSYIYTKKRKPKNGKALPPEFKGKVEIRRNKIVRKIKKPRITYSQDWPTYNKGQTNEEPLFFQILNDAIEFLQIEEKWGGRGRPFSLMSDMIKCCIIKVYYCRSSRRIIGRLKLLKKTGYVTKIPHYNTIINYMGNPETTLYLNELVKITSRPFKHIETNFAPDSTGISTNIKDFWTDVRFGSKKIKHRKWKKLHIMTGTKTNIVTAVKVTDAYAHDSPQFENLFNTTSETFQIKEVSADPAYSSRKNVQIVANGGATPYILPKESSVVHSRARGSSAWKTLLNFLKKHRDEFMKHYHQRSNVESTFSMIERKFSKHIKSKKDLSQENEILCKIICHNISVLASAIFQIGIDINFNN